MKDYPILFTTEMVQAIINGKKTQTRRIKKSDKFPYQLGTKLWVKETFLNNALPGYDPVYYYRADSKDKPADRKWKTPIFMPRSASRITLEVTGIRVEKLQHLSIDDAVSEGIRFIEPAPGRIFSGYRDYSRKNFTTHNPIYSFLTLWESLYGFGSWAENPHVWVITFKKI